MNNEIVKKKNWEYLHNFWKFKTLKEFECDDNKNSEFFKLNLSWHLYITHRPCPISAANYTCFQYPLPDFST